MFDFVRKHNRVMQFLLVLLIFPSFVLFGLEGYNRYREKGEDAARVDGHDISQQEWDQAYKIEVDRIRQQMPTLDAKVFDTPEAKYGALERLVRERVVAAAAQHSNLATSDQRLARELGRNELIASLRGPDGKLDMAKYRQLVSEVITPKFRTSFESGVTAAEQTVAKAGVARTAKVFATGVSTIDADSATALVAGSFTNSYPQGKRRVNADPAPFRVRVTLVKTDGKWLVDNFTPVTGEAQ